jgi:hypothetical protein
MNERDIELAKSLGFFLNNQQNFARIEAFIDFIRADERERIKAANAPEIERINAHLKSLEDAVKAEREACARIVVTEAMQYAEPTWAFEILNDIRARGKA